jgi:uncharacterized SAM-binding protein YcdF (DUF218 family)
VDGLLLIKATTALILPPGGILVLLVVGIALRSRRPRLGAALVVSAVLTLYALSAGPISAPLIERLERFPALADDDPRLADRQAIVVLGGGRRERAPELGGPTVSASTLERLRYAAWLHRRTGLPLAVSGGVALGDGPTLAELMAAALERDFAVSARWLEAGSRNTEQNAIFTRQVLSTDGVTRIALVSHAAHLPRAVPMFRNQGFDVLPAPTGFLSPLGDSYRLLDWLPSAQVFWRSAIALHEHLGRLWYRLRRD